MEGQEALNEGHIIDLILQTLLVLVVGFALWKISSLMARKRSKPKGSNFFDTKYRDNWKK